MSEDYVVQGPLLGSGLNGEVQIAASKQHPSGQECAMTAFKLARVAPDGRRMLVSEVEVFVSLGHPHVVRFYDVREELDILYLITGCIEGGELMDRAIELKTFKEHDAAHAVDQMLLAVTFTATTWPLGIVCSNLS
ncbi:unnamed protein product [Prorocentrum cordatum]|uniref:Protein kinase domain-containing protein n=1 Tax=Prorocentrum cordatum TaxID=2364126 RepID=A0ABN9UCI8_9DINO|nr:unnamed protein product [Polarella glacialis]